MIYLDSSAVFKLARREAESEALNAWLGQHSTPSRVSSELGRVEVLRTARRYGDRVVNEAHAVLADIDLIPLDRAVQDLACDIGEPHLRALDALHLASAVLLRDQLMAFVAYDHRLARAAETAGLSVASPGAPAQ